MQKIYVVVGFDVDNGHIYAETFTNYKKAKKHCEECNNELAPIEEREGHSGYTIEITILNKCK